MIKKKKKDFCANKCTNIWAATWENLFLPYAYNKGADQPAPLLLVWSESSLCAQSVAKDPRFLHADREDSDRTGRMPRLIWVFTGHTVILLVLSCRGSFESEQDKNPKKWPVRPAKKASAQTEQSLRRLSDWGLSPWLSKELLLNSLIRLPSCGGWSLLVLFTYFYIIFNSISVISGLWEVDNDCSVQRSDIHVRKNLASSLGESNLLPRNLKSGDLTALFYSFEYKWAAAPQNQQNDLGAHQWLRSA